MFALSTPLPFQVKQESESPGIERKESEPGAAIPEVDNPRKIA
jgi:hypothetical protein